jgi:hypothetical protein
LKIGMKRVNNFALTMKMLQFFCDSKNWWVINHNPISTLFSQWMKKSDVMWTSIVNCSTFRLFFFPVLLRSELWLIIIYCCFISEHFPGSFFIEHVMIFKWEKFWHCGESWWWVFLGIFFGVFLEYVTFNFRQFNGSQKQ